MSNIRRGIVQVFVLGVAGAFCAGASAQDLLSEYWENVNPIPATPGVPAGTATVTEAVTIIDFTDGAAGNPPALFPTTTLNDFVARYSGYIQGPTTGTVTFETTSDDGVELRVNNQAVVSNWTDHAETVNPGNFDMVQGLWYPIQLLFYERGGNARIRLRWSYQGQALIHPPTQYISQTPPAPPAPVIVSSQAGDLQSTFNNFQWTYAGVGTEFRIYADGNFLASVPITTFTYTDTTANAYNVTTCYTVRAVNGVESPDSNQACLTPVPPPPRTNDHDEGLFDDRCACGSSIPARPGAAALLAALLIAGALAMGRR